MRPDPRFFRSAGRSARLSATWHRRCFLKAVRKFPLLPKFDPLAVKTALELAAGGVIWLLLMRWFAI